MSLSQAALYSAHRRKPCAAELHFIQKTKAFSIFLELFPLKTVESWVSCFLRSKKTHSTAEQLVYEPENPLKLARLWGQYISLTGLSVQARQVTGKTVAAVARAPVQRACQAVACELPTWSSRCGSFASFCIHMSGKL